MSIVIFDYAAWALRYPEFDATVSEPAADEYFVEACIYLDNTACAIVPYEPDATPPVITRRVLLNMIVAHIAYLNQPGSSPIVGRISDATEGTVNVKAEFLAPNSAQWWISTKYGAAYWQATSAYRTARYIPGPQFGLPPYLGYGGAPWLR